MNESLVIEFEKILLGQCLQDGGFVENAFPKVRSILDAADFILVPHQLIFGAIVALDAADKAIFPAAVAKQLDSDNMLNRLDGGWGYIKELYDVCTEIESVEDYAKEIKGFSNERKACAILTKVKQAFDDPSLSLNEKLDILDTEREKIDTSHKSLEVVSALELSQMDIPSVKWIVPDLIPDGLTVLAGDAKIGKSFFAWNIAISVALGGVALSSIDIEKSRNVTYLALEDPRALLQERLDLLCYGGDIPENIHIINDMNNIKFDAFGLKTLEGIIESTNSELVVVDTWKHVAPDIQDKNGTSYDVDYQRMIPVQRFVQAKNIAMILVTHTRKAADPDNPFNQIQGSMGIQAGCDTMLKIGRDTGGHSLHVTGRNMPSDEYAINLTQGGLWELEGRVNDVRKTETRQIIIDMLVDAGNDGLTASDIITCSERKEGAVRLQLRRMLRDGDIIQPNKRGRYYYPNNDDNISL